MTSQLTRRELLGYAVLVAAGVATMPKLALAEAMTAQELLDKFTSGKTASEDKITLSMPEIAENGNTVPLTVSVDSPMTADDYVKSVIIVASGNPRPEVATFHFSPRSGVAEASTRMRLAKTQDVVAVAELSDGSFHMAKREVKVTIGGCGG